MLYAEALWPVLGRTHGSLVAVAEVYSSTSQVYFNRDQVSNEHQVSNTSRGSDDYVLIDARGFY